jgi:16S rRNA (cytosine1402-N4)-methyltransferase
MLARVAPGGRLVCLDVDPDALGIAEARLKPLGERRRVRVDVLRGNFAELSRQLSDLSLDGPVRGIVADLGVSSMQLDRPERGFSFRCEAPLDLRMDPSLEKTGADLLRELPESRLADLLYDLGGERGSRRVARRIVSERSRGSPIETTVQLERLVRSALKVRGHRRTHPATRTFQALRMAVNRELEVLEAFLNAAPECLASGGVLAVISFHSGEDRVVKQGFKALAGTGRFQVMRKSVVRPGVEERRANPRSRSAKLRGLRKI